MAAQRGGGGRAGGHMGPRAPGVPMRGFVGGPHRGPGGGHGWVSRPAYQQTAVSALWLYGIGSYYPFGWTTPAVYAPDPYPYNPAPNVTIIMVPPVTAPAARTRVLSASHSQRTGGREAHRASTRDRVVGVPHRGEGRHCLACTRLHCRERNGSVHQHCRRAEATPARRSGRIHDGATESRARCGCPAYAMISRIRLPDTSVSRMCRPLWK